jgi:hypothetical protein
LGDINVTKHDGFWGQHVDSETDTGHSGDPRA